MIGFLRGSLIAKSPENLQCVVLVNEVGYELTVNKTLFESLTIGQAVEWWIHTHMKESVFTYYGFAEEIEKKFFRLLLGISGLGPKSALSLLGQHGVPTLSQLIKQKDAKAIATAPGVGKKSAERIVLELNPKLEKLFWLESLDFDEMKPRDRKQMEVESSVQEDLSTALINLGYQSSKVQPLIEKYFETADPSGVAFEHHLRQLLGTLSGRGASAPLEN